MSILQESIEVYVDEDGNGCIAHIDMSEDCFVALPPEHVDVLISWLQAKRAEAVRYRETMPGSKPEN